ncbi:MAG TPA: CBS domain-containing protein [Opitutaceae bacterium]|nr:CBS domain-containing protein [Opitutaceae bacterium]
MNTAIATLLERKDAALHTVPTTVSVAEAVETMNQHRIGSVLVMSGQRLVGIFTERDVLRRVVGEQLDPRTTPVTKVMSTDVITVLPATTTHQAMEIFAEKRCRHLPVMDDGRLVGVISIGDVSRWMSDMHRAEAESLRQYIAGGLPA